MTAETTIRTPEDLAKVIAELVPADGRPILAYTGIFAIARALNVPGAELPRVLLEILQDAARGRDLLMPTYGGGFRNGIVNLDSEPCNTGMVNERFRLQPETLRTASAFFSFGVSGPSAEILAAQRPVDAWGDGSLFEWVENYDAHILMLGVPWCMCSFLHRSEWHERVPYRYLKSFSGTMIRDGLSEPLTERLFVRGLEPPVQNIWPGLDGLLANVGMEQRSLGQSQVAAVNAQALVLAVRQGFRRDPFAFVKNPELLRQRYGKTAATAAL